MIFYNIASVAALAFYNEKTETNFSWGLVGRNFYLNPLLLACVVGLIFQLFEWPIPTAVVRTCSVVGDSAFAIALLGIGSQLAAISAPIQWLEAFVSTTLKCIICPLVGWMIGIWVGLTGVELQVVVLLCAMPSSVSSYVLADQMDGDSDLAASTVIVSTAFSLITLSILLAIT